VNFILDENGVINVHPAVVNVLFEHLVKYNLRRLLFIILSATYQKDSGYFTTSVHNHNLNGRKLNVLYKSYSSRGLASFFKSAILLKNCLKDALYSSSSLIVFAADL